MEAHICPNCGAETTKNVCEYCGEKISIFGTLPQGNTITTKIDVKNILVAPFKIDNNRAEKRFRLFLKMELGAAFNETILTDIKVKSIYIPVGFYTKFDKFFRHKICCSIEDLPSIFQNGYFPNRVSSRFTLHKSDYLYHKTDKDKELNRADIVMTPAHSFDAPEGVDDFVDYAFTAYLPFWIMEGKINDEYSFVMYLYGGIERYQEVTKIREVICSVYSAFGEEISLKSIKAEYDKIQQQKAQEARTQKNKEKVARREAEEAAVKKDNRKFNILILITIIIAIIGGLAFQSLFGGDIAVRIIIGLVFGLATGFLGFLILMKILE